MHKKHPSAAYIVWFVVSKYINEKDDEITDLKDNCCFWRNSQWVPSGLSLGYLDSWSCDGSYDYPICLSDDVINARCCKYSSINFTEKNRPNAIYFGNGLGIVILIYYIFGESSKTDSKNSSLTNRFGKNRH